MIAYFKQLSNVKKLVVYIGSSIVTGAVDAGLVPAGYEHYVQLTVFFLTSIGIYAAANRKPTAASAAAAAGQAVETALAGPLPTMDQLNTELDGLAAGAHAAPAPLPLPPLPPMSLADPPQPPLVVPAG